MKRMLVFVVVALVFLSGCVSDESTEEIQTNSYIGIVTSAYAGSLPSLVYEGESIPMQFLVENQGDYDINAGAYFLKIKGINPSAFKNLNSRDLKASSTTDMASLSAFGEETIVRGEEVISISDNACYTNDLENDLNLNIHAKSCYTYGTVSSAPACFVKISGNGDGLCSPSEFKPVTNTIAPLIVTELAQSPAGETSEGYSKYRFRVKVENLGAGDIFSNSVAVKKCDDLKSGEENLVFIDSVTLDGQTLDKDILFYEGGVTTASDYYLSGTEEVDGITVPLYVMKELSGFRLDSNGAGRFSFIIVQKEDIEFVGDLDIALGYAYTQTDVFTTTIKALPDQEPNCS